MSNNSSDKIRNRLFKNASKLWGVQQAELSGLDPVVNMLFGACSKEFEKIYNEQDSSQSRVLERLSKLLLPEVNAKPLPAHGIIHGRPYEPVSVLSKKAQLYFRKNKPLNESNQKENYTDIYFTPLNDLLLVDGKIKYSVSPFGLYEHDEVYIKERLFGYENNAGKRLAFFIGIELNSSIKNLDKLSIYFDWPTNSEKDRLLNTLPFVKASVNSKELDVSIGYNMNNPKEDDETKVGNNFDLLHSEESIISSYYDNRFITLNIKEQGGISFLEKTLYPTSFPELFNKKNLDKLDKELLWIELTFPSYISDDALDELICSINSFPVCNKKLNELNFRIQPNFNIVPLSTGDEYLFNVESVTSKNGQEYTTAKIADTNKIENGEYIVRKGGVERFDQRNAKDLLSYLIDLLRDESAAFSLFGQEAISTNLLELNQQLASLEQKVKKTISGETANYIMVKPKTASDNIFVEFWTTNGDKGNNIRIGSKLQVASNADLRQEDTVLLSNSTTGGRDPISQSEVLNNFKSSLITRDRIVTKADVKAFCSKELNGQIKKISLKNKFEIGTDKNNGFYKFLEIEIDPINSELYKVEEWEALSVSLQRKIESKSSFLLPIKVKINHN